MTAHAPSRETEQVESVVEVDYAAPDVLGAVDDLRHFAEFAEVLRAHLTSVGDLTESASVAILTQLFSIETSVSALVEHIDNSMNSPRYLADMRDAQSSIKEGSQALSSFVEERALTRTEMSGSLAETGRNAHAIQSLAGDVSRISLQTSMLAINAGIQAARSGSAGLGFNVIAKEIRMLADESGRVSAQLRGQMAALSDQVSKSLLVIFEKRALEEQRSCDVMQSAFSRLTGHMTDLFDLQRELLARVHSDSGAIVGPVMELTGSIQFQDIVRQQLEQVSAALLRASSHIVVVADAAAFGDELPPIAFADHLNEIYNGYVMQQQRDTHEGRSSGPAVAMVELF